MRPGIELGADGHEARRLHPRPARADRLRGHVALAVVLGNRAALWLLIGVSAGVVEIVPARPRRTSRPCSSRRSRRGA